MTLNRTNLKYAVKTRTLDGGTDCITWIKEHYPRMAVHMFLRSSQTKRKTSKYHTFSIFHNNAQHTADIFSVPGFTCCRWLGHRVLLETRRLWQHGRQPEGGRPAGMFVSLKEAWQREWAEEVEWKWMPGSFILPFVYKNEWGLFGALGLHKNVLSNSTHRAVILLVRVRHLARGCIHLLQCTEWGS